MSFQRYVVFGNSAIVPGIGMMKRAQFDDAYPLQPQLEEWARAEAYDMDFGVVAVPFAAEAGGPLGTGPV